jgi:type VI secretion system protein ImpE
VRAPSRAGKLKRRTRGEPGDLWKIARCQAHSSHTPIEGFELHAFVRASAHIRRRKVVAMEAERLLKEGKLKECLASVQDAVRKEPANSKYRVFLSQLLCVTGQWERALTQFKVAGELDVENMLMSSVCEPAIQCEMLRAQVFSGQRSPLIFGEPAEWVAWMIQANQLSGTGRLAEGAALRAQALEQAPATSGTIDGKPFDWIADADSRLGPILELIVNGKYYWVPFHRISSLTLETPTDLRDLVWLPAQVQWSNGGQAIALVPVRYPGSEASEDPAIRLSRKTDWAEQGEDLVTGLGQRMFTTDADDYPLLGTRSIQLGEPIGVVDETEERAGKAANG